MKKMVMPLIWVGIVSIVLGLISRIAMKPLIGFGLESRAFAGFAAILFLLAIAIEGIPVNK